MSDSAHLACIACAATYPLKHAHFRCRCEGLLEVVRPLKRLPKRTFETRLREPSGVWRYREWLAPIPSRAVVSKEEGDTPLVSHPRLNEWTGCENLLLKHEGENPTGSFKDRGMTVATSHARWIGARFVACASTGNTSSSAAAYAAAAGLRLLAFVPEGKLAMGKLSQTLAYGARTVQVRGDFDSAMRLVQQVAVQRGLYLMNSINPFRLDGQKTIIYETLHQLGWKAPDWIAVPGGNLGNTSAFGRALRDLRDLGIIRRMPRLAVIQAAGANPFYTAFKSGLGELKPVAAETIATAIRIGNPVNYPKARRSIEWTRGVVEQVTDDEIREAKRLIDAAGIGCEPASASSVAGVRALVRAGVIKRRERVVAVLTGHILKDPDAILTSFDPKSIVTIDPSLESVERLLRE